MKIKHKKLIKSGNNRHKTANIITAMMINRENENKRKPEKLTETKISEVFKNK